MDEFIPKIPNLKEFPELSGMKSVKLSKKSLQSSDVVLIITNHGYIDFEMVGKHSDLIIDTRNAMDKIKTEATIVKA